ncbi:flavodoxin domain-containing protein [Terrisporobacter sp.]
MFYNRKIAIVYKSKYGCTMKYAGWLAIKLDADLYEISDVGRWDLLKYKTIIFGSPIYNSRIYLLDYLLEKYKMIKNKNLILYCVSLNLQNRKDIIDYNFEDKEIKDKIKFFFLGGSINYGKLTKVDKIRLKKGLKKRLSFDTVNLQKNISTDKSDKHAIKPIINYVLEKNR